MLVGLLVGEKKKSTKFAIVNNSYQLSRSERSFNFKKLTIDFWVNFRVIGSLCAWCVPPAIFPAFEYPPHQTPTIKRQHIFFESGPASICLSHCLFRCTVYEWFDPRTLRPCRRCNRAATRYQDTTIFDIHAHHRIRLTLRAVSILSHRFFTVTNPVSPGSPNN